MTDLPAPPPDPKSEAPYVAPRKSVAERALSGALLMLPVLFVLGVVALVVFALSQPPSGIDYPGQEPVAPSAVTAGLPTQESVDIDAKAMLIAVTENEGNYPVMQQAIQAKYPTCAVAAGASGIKNTADGKTQLQAFADKAEAEAPFGAPVVAVAANKEYVTGVAVSCP